MNNTNCCEVAVLAKNAKYILALAQDSGEEFSEQTKSALFVGMDYLNRIEEIIKNTQK